MSHWWQEGAILRAVHASMISYSISSAASGGSSSCTTASSDLVSASLSRDAVYAGYAREADASAAAGGADSLISVAFAHASTTSNCASSASGTFSFDVVALLRVDDLLGGVGTTLEGDSYERAMEEYFYHEDGEEGGGGDGEGEGEGEGKGEGKGKCEVEGKCEGEGEDEALAL